VAMIIKAVRTTTILRKNSDCFGYLNERKDATTKAIMAAHMRNKSTYSKKII